MDMIDRLELQVRVLDSNIEDLTQNVQLMNHNLMVYFASLNFFPSPFPYFQLEPIHEDPPTYG